MWILLWVIVRSKTEEKPEIILSGKGSVLDDKEWQKFLKGVEDELDNMIEKEAYL